MAAAAGGRAPTDGDAGLGVGLTTGTLRAILDVPATGGGRAEELARRIGHAIRVGLILDGERLPSESRLAGQLGVAVVTLREVLRILRQEGLISTRPGRGGGTVVTAPADRDRTLRGRLAALSLAEVRDLGDHRAAVLAAAAERAATRGLPAEMDRLRGLVERFVGVEAVGRLRRLDALLAAQVATAAQSPRLVREDMRLRAEVGDLLWWGSTAPDRRAAVVDRTEMVAAIDERDPVRARAGAEAVVAGDTHRLAAAHLRAGASARDGGIPAEPGERLAAVHASLAPFGTEVAELVRDRAGRPARGDLGTLRPSIDRLLHDHDRVVVGAGVVLEPGLLEDAARWLEWWWTSEDRSIQPLRVNLDPAAPDFYDYTAERWFRDARETGEPQVVGPYVDASCTGVSCITLSRPVVVDGRFVGVVAADVPASVVEDLALPWLRAADERLLLAADGRVLASLDPAVLPGELVPAVESDPDGAVRLDRDLRRSS